MVGCAKNREKNVFKHIYAELGIHCIYILYNHRMEYRKTLHTNSKIRLMSMKFFYGAISMVFKNKFINRTFGMCVSSIKNSYLVKLNKVTKTKAKIECILQVILNNWFIHYDMMIISHFALYNNNQYTLTNTRPVVMLFLVINFFLCKAEGQIIIISYILLYS